MTTTVVDVDPEVYYRVDGRLHRIKDQLRQKGGYPYNPEALADALQDLGDGRFPAARQNEFENEELREHFLYPAGFRFRTPQEQIKFWGKHFPKLDASQALQLVRPVVPRGAESWGVIPKFSKLGGYQKGLEKMFELLGQRQFQNWRKGQLGPEYLRLAAKTEQILTELDKEMPGDFLVFPFQFGLRHAGKSIRRARLTFSEPEFGLGPYEAAALLLSHPDRITAPNQLCVDCAGAEFSPNAGGGFWDSVCFGWSDVFRCLGFVSSGVDNADRIFGSVSAFRP